MHYLWCVLYSFPSFIFFFPIIFQQKGGRGWIDTWEEFPILFLIPFKSIASFSFKLTGKLCKNSIKMFSSTFFNHLTENSFVKQLALQLTEHRYLRTYLSFICFLKLMKKKMGLTQADYHSWFWCNKSFPTGTIFFGTIFSKRIIFISKWQFIKTETGSGNVLASLKV